MNRRIIYLKYFICGIMWIVGIVGAIALFINGEINFTWNKDVRFGIFIFLLIYSIFFFGFYRVFISTELDNKDVFISDFERLKQGCQERLLNGFELEEYELIFLRDFSDVKLTYSDVINIDMNDFEHKDYKNSILKIRKYIKVKK